eukprot:CAMPEP_0174846006 /NCGR_PEP_ID=MMETSP1114-20130205/12067_1 /TAXON_ID=312471 /ORGANISM="Neobodo designis, Strain CCAP 1951/1" /LENGTH=116 /DNA_ID=CAMNT_0016080263 /DNA_START=98 /DNA_END=445 /DNA_ORIENTATION=+
MPTKMLGTSEPTSAPGTPHQHSVAESPQRCVSFVAVGTGPNTQAQSPRPLPDDTSLRSNDDGAHTPAWVASVRSRANMSEDSVPRRTHSNANPLRITSTVTKVSQLDASISTPLSE